MTDSLLDFSLSPRRKETVRFDLLDEDLNPIGQVYPVGAPSLTVDRARQVKRSLTGVTLFPPDSERLTWRSRLRPVWVFDDGTEWPCGVFVLSDETVRPDGDGRLDAVAMGDQMSLYREPLEQTFSVKPGDSVLDKLVELHERASTPASRLGWGHITALASSGLVWPPGTLITDALEELAATAAVEVWFNRRGTLRFDLLSDEPNVVDLSHHIEGTLKFSYSNEDTPNRWVARSNDVDFSISGSYDLPASAPHSFAKRGRLVVREVEVPGLVGQDAADDAARDAAFDEEFPYKEASLDVPGRPDLDVHDSLRLSNGQVFRLDSVSTELESSGISNVQCQAEWENPDTTNREPKLSFDGGEPIPGSVPPLNPKILWNPAFLKMWRKLSPKQRRKLTKYLEAAERKEIERREKRERRRRRQQRRRRKRRRQSRPAKPRAGRVRSYDPDINVATVLLDGDSQGNEITARVRSDIPGTDQRVMVGFGSPTPEVIGVEGGAQRLLGWAKSSTTNQVIGSGSTTGVIDAQVEVSVTQPGRLLMLVGQAQVQNASGGGRGDFSFNTPDAPTSWTPVGRWGRDAFTGSPGALWSGNALVANMEPGVYSFRLEIHASAGCTVRNEFEQAHIMVVDMGASRIATSTALIGGLGGGGAAESGGYVSDGSAEMG